MYELHLGDCLDVLPKLDSASADAVITDPPYPEITKTYGRMSESEWHEMMDEVVVQCQRLLKPTGSAVFIVQPNWETIGKMRLWVWEFLLRTATKWNLIQDVYWWNHTTVPGNRHGLLRPSVKYCLWFGSPDCYRNQSEVLWAAATDDLKAKRWSDRREGRPCGNSINHKKIYETTTARGGSTPFNLLPIPGVRPDEQTADHPARFPQELSDWWVRYICPPGGTVCDPFMGSGTTLASALKYQRHFIGIEKDRRYCEMAERRLHE